MSPVNKIVYKRLQMVRPECRHDLVFTAGMSKNIDSHENSCAQLDEPVHYTTHNKHRISKKTSLRRSA